jgi:hypothetical protein
MLGWSAVNLISGMIELQRKYGKVKFLCKISVIHEFLVDLPLE